MHSKVLNFIFEKDGGFGEFFKHQLVQDNEEEFYTFIQGILGMVFNCEPGTNIKFSFVDLIDQQGVLNTKHSLTGVEQTTRLLPSFQSFSNSSKKLDMKHVILMEPKQYENNRERPRELLEFFFAVTNAYVEKNDSLQNYIALVKLQYIVWVNSVFPVQLKRLMPTLAALSYENPTQHLRELNKGASKQNYVEGIESMFLGQPLATGVNSVVLIEVSHETKTVQTS